MAPASVGKRLKRLRESRDLTQDQLADLIGVKERTISRYETGASRGLYDDGVLEQLAAALKVEPEDIIGPRAVPPAELHDVKAQLDRLEQRLALIIEYFDITATKDGHPELSFRVAYGSAPTGTEPEEPPETEAAS